MPDLSEKEINRQIDFAVSVNTTGLDQANKLREILQNTVKIKKDSIKADKDLAKAIKEGVDELGKLNTTYKNTGDTLGKFTEKTSKFLGLLGISVASYREIEQSLMSYNKTLLDVTNSYRKYGIGSQSIIKNTQTLSKELKITENDYLSLISGFEKSFNQSSLKNVDNLIKNIRKSVGSDVQAIQQLGSQIAAMGNQFPDLEPFLMSYGQLNKVEQNRIANQTKLLFLTGQINNAQYKQMQDYFAGSKNMSLEEAKRLQELQSLKASIEDIQRVLQHAIVNIGNMASPFITAFRTIFDTIPNSGEIVITSFIALTLAKFTGLSKILSPLMSRAMSGAATSAVGQAEVAVAKSGLLAKIFGMSTGNSLNSFKGGAGGMLGGLRNPGSLLKGLGGRVGLLGAGAAAYGVGSAIYNGTQGEQTDWKSVGYDIASALANFLPFGPFISLGMQFFKEGIMGALGFGSKGESLDAFMAKQGDGNSQKDTSEKAMSDAQNVYLKQGASGVKGLIDNINKSIDEARAKSGMTEDQYESKKEEYLKLSNLVQSGKLDSGQTGEANTRMENIKRMIDVFEKNTAGLNTQKASYEQFLNSQSALLDDKIKAFGDAFTSGVDNMKAAIELNAFSGAGVSETLANFDPNKAFSDLANKLQSQIAQMDLAKNAEESNRSGLVDQRNAAAAKGENTSGLDSNIQASTAKIEAIMQQREAAIKRTRLEQQKVYDVLKDTSVIFQRLQNQAELFSNQSSFAAMGGDIAGAFDLAQKSIDNVRASIGQSGQQLAAIQKAINNEQGKLGSASGDERKAIEANLQNLLQQQRDTLAQQLNSRKEMIQKTLDLAKVNQPVLDLQNSNLSRMQSELELINSIGAGLGVSVAQRMEIVKMGDAIIEQQEMQRDFYKQQVIEAQKTGNNEQLIASAKALNEAETAILQTRMQQLNVTKQLRDGWISAMTASVQGSGMITKFVVSQEKNTAIAVQNLGAIQSATSGGASGGYRQSRRYGAGGIGQISGRTAEDEARIYNMQGGGPIRESENIKAAIENRLNSTKQTSMQANALGANPLANSLFMQNAQEQVGVTKGISEKVENVARILQGKGYNLAIPTGGTSSGSIPNTSAPAGSFEALKGSNTPTLNTPISTPPSFSSLPASDAPLPLNNPSMQSAVQQKKGFDQKEFEKNYSAISTVSNKILPYFEASKVSPQAQGQRYGFKDENGNSANMQFTPDYIQHINSELATNMYDYMFAAKLLKNNPNDPAAVAKYEKASQKVMEVTANAQKDLIGFKSYSDRQQGSDRSSALRTPWSQMPFEGLNDKVSSIKGTIPKFANGGIVPDMSGKQGSLRKMLGLSSGDMGSDTTIAALTPGEKVISKNSSNNITINASVTVDIGEMDKLGKKIADEVNNGLNKAFNGPGFRNR